MGWWQRMWHKLSLKMNMPAMDWDEEIKEGLLDEEEEEKNNWGNLHPSG